jgi:hypothetical protein
MNIADNIAELERRRDARLRNLQTDSFHFVRRLEHRYSPARLIRKNIGWSLGLSLLTGSWLGRRLGGKIAPGRAAPAGDGRAAAPSHAPPGAHQTSASGGILGSLVASAAAELIQAVPWRMVGAMFRSRRPRTDESPSTKSPPDDSSEREPPPASP